MKKKGESKSFSKKTSSNMRKFRISVGYRSAVIFLLTFALCSLLTAFTVLNRINMENLSMNRMLIVKSTRVIETISRLTYKTESLSALVRRGGGDSEAFVRIASAIVDDPSVLNVLIAPDGIVSDVYPLEGNESIVGLDIITDSVGAKEAAEAKESGQIVLGGPFELKRGIGQWALLAELPVYNNGDFSGFVSLALKYPQVLDGAGLDELLLQGFAYEIWKPDPENGERRIIADSGTKVAGNARFIDKKISVLNAEWYFRIISIREWYEYPEMWILIFISVCISFLVARLQIMTQRAKKASTAKSDFLASMSHEIRTPMNAVIGMSDLLLMENLTEKQYSYAKDIKISAAALLDIINDILDVSKIEAGKLTLSPANFDLLRLIDNILSIMSLAAKNKGLDFISEISTTIPECLYGDDIRIRQILINLIGNAVKFTESGFVKLAADYADRAVKFTVSDTGVGIKESDIERLYDSFEQFDVSRNRGKTGTGLGLSITKSLIDMMGGKIEVSSVYGKGSVFSVEIPLVHGDKSKITGIGGEFAFMQAKGAEVLLVDDVETNRNVGRGLLRLNGIECDTAESGADALRKVTDKDYDLIFMDHMMPDMDGIEAAAKIRAVFKKSARKCPAIVALTANASPEARELLLGAGMDDFLTKPIDKAVLNSTLKKWIPREKQNSEIIMKPLENNESALIELAAGIDGLDVEAGLRHVNGAAEYERSLKLLCESLPDTLINLKKYLDDGDFKKFKISVHGLKGALAVNGHTKLSGDAQLLEDAAESENLLFCRDSMPEFTKKLEILRESLKKIFAPPQDAGKQKGEYSMLIKSLGLIENHISNFSRDSALKELEILSEYSFGGEIDTVIEKMRAAAENFDLDLIDELLQTIIPAT